MSVEWFSSFWVNQSSNQFCVLPIDFTMSFCSSSSNSLNLRAGLPVRLFISSLPIGSTSMIDCTSRYGYDSFSSIACSGALIISICGGRATPAWRIVNSKEIRSQSFGPNRQPTTRRISQASISRAEPQRTLNGYACLAFCIPGGIHKVEPSLFPLEIGNVSCHPKEP